MTAFLFGVVIGLVVEVVGARLGWGVMRKLMTVAVAAPLSWATFYFVVLQ